MIAEWLMERYGWDAVWFLGSNGRTGRYSRPLNFLRRDACLVGTWTGPDLDLLCVRKCQTAEDAEAYLSPSGWTVTHAAIRAWWKLLTVDVGQRSSCQRDTQRTRSRNSKECRGGYDYDG